MSMNWSQRALGLLVAVLIPSLGWAKAGPESLSCEEICNSCFVHEALMHDVCLAECPTDPDGVGRFLGNLGRLWGAGSQCVRALNQMESPSLVPLHLPFTGGETAN
jgi:hypothetical protein